MTDHIGSAHMTQGFNTSFVADRFGNENSALALNGGWTQVPPGVYFNTHGFTISVWVLPQMVGKWSRVIDFGNGAPSDNVVLTLDSGTTNEVPILAVDIGLNFKYEIPYIRIFLFFRKIKKISSIKNISFK